MSPQIERIWLHIGMPKCGSTAIQLWLNSVLANYPLADWSYSDVEESVKNMDFAINAFSDRLNSPRPQNTYSPLVSRVDNRLVISSENYSYFPGLQTFNSRLSVLALIREPLGWMKSMMGQDLLFGIPSNPSIMSNLFNDKIEKSEDQLLSLFRFYRERYEGMLDNLSYWKNSCRVMRLVPYTKDQNLFRIVSDDLQSFGVTTDGYTWAPRLRLSYSFAHAQLAYGIQQCARYEFGLSNSEANELGQRALGVEESFLNSGLIPVTTEGRGLILAEVSGASEKYLQCLESFGTASPREDLGNLNLQTFDPKFLLSLSRLLIRTSIKRGVLPESFDAKSYLKLNPELEEEARRHGDVDEFARIHFESHGVFQNRPSSSSE